MTGSDARAIVVQDRDRQLLHELAVLRVADREQLKVVAGFGSTTRANCRFLALSRAGLLRRFFLGTVGGARKALYALSPKGAQVAQVPYRGPRRRQDEVLVADFSVMHQLAVNRVYCLVKYEPIPVPGARFVRWVAFHEPLESGLAFIPDGFFEIAAEKQGMGAFLEVDLGHESRTVWRGKVEAYLRYALSGLCAEGLGQSRFRTVVIADSDRRVASLRMATAEITEKIFWFTTFEAIEREGFWSPIWQRPKTGTCLPLIHTP
jgi:hypothetical protein